jgi:hypothetical protein
MDFLVTTALVALLAGAGDPPGQVETLPKGQLVENLASRTAGQRFTIYIPTSYDGSRPAPILYVMDPRGRARVGAKLFQPSAERYGYIVISSHNTASDVAAEGNLRAMQAMWDDSHEWFAIDPTRVYVAGFSGTARIASLMARHMSAAITGIIGSAAAYHPDVRPARESAFLYFGTVGNADYNFHEMESLEESLASLDLPHRIARFAGSHSWLPPDLAMEAIEWLELRAMQAGTEPRDPASIERWWMRDEEAARTAEAEGRHLDAARRWSAMVRDYAGLRDTAGATVQAGRLRSANTTRDQLKQRQGQARGSREWLRHAMGVISDAFPPETDAPVRSTADLAAALDVPRLKRTASGGRTDAALEAQRRLNELAVQLGFYLPVEAVTASDATRANYYLSVSLQIDDRSPVSWYLLGRIYAGFGAKAEAIAALERAYDAGFRDAALLEADSGFRPLRTIPGYTAFLERLRASGDLLDLLTVDRPPTQALPLR